MIHAQLYIQWNIQYFDRAVYQIFFLVMGNLGLVILIITSTWLSSCLCILQLWDEQQAKLVTFSREFTDINRISMTPQLSSSLNIQLTTLWKIANVSERARGHCGWEHCKNYPVVMQSSGDAFWMTCWCDERWELLHRLCSDSKCSTLELTGCLTSR